MAEQNFLAPGPTKAEFDTLNGTVSGLSDQMANKASIANGMWTPNIPRATFTVSTGTNRIATIGSLYCFNANLDISAALESNAYIEGSSFTTPAGKARSGIIGEWTDLNNNYGGLLVGASNGNVWFLSGDYGAPMSLKGYIGHTINIIGHFFVY